jgi:gliding motility-associated-like protein
MRLIWFILGRGSLSLKKYKMNIKAKKITVFLFFQVLLAILTTLSVNAQASCPVTDRQTDSLALVGIYQSTKGANWFNKWDLAKPMDTWNGILLFNGRLWSIFIANENNLDGSFNSDAFFYLCKVKDIVITNNKKLVGKIPDLNKLVEARRIIFDRCGFSGEITAIDANLITTKRFKSLNLQELSLSGNMFSGSVPELYTPILNKINLSNNSLTGEIQVIKADKLAELDLSSNQITGSIPNFNLPNLTKLNLSDNMLTGIIPNMAGTPKISSFCVRNNALDSLTILSKKFLFPTSFDPYSTCRGLEVANNKLTFDDIIPNGAYFSAGPQDSILTESTLEGIVGFSLTIELKIDGAITDNTYKWFKNSVFYKDVSQNKLIFNNLSLNDSGIYTCEITNPNAPFGFGKLFSRKTTLNICSAYSTKILDTTVCGSSYISPSGKIFTTASIFKDTLKRKSGTCDSIRYDISVTFQIKQTRPDTNVLTCLKQPYPLPWSTRKISVAGTHADTLKSTKGCDSLIRNVIVTALVNTPKADTSIQICQGKTVTLPYSKKVVSTAATYGDTLKNTGGCDTLTRNVVLTYKTAVSRADTSVQICQGKTFVLPYTRQSVTLAKTYKDFLLGFEGCDSIVRNVIISYKTAQFLPDEAQTICFGSSYTLPWTRKAVNTEGVQKDTLKGFDGCDSLIKNIRVSIYRPQKGTTRITGCFNEPKIYNGITFTPQSPSSIETLKGRSAYGCDSTNEIIVTFNRAKALADNYTITSNETIDTLIKVTKNDIIAGTYKLTITTPLIVGSAEGDGNGNVRIEMPVNYLNEIKFSYRICSDGCVNECSVAEVLLKLNRDGAIRKEGGEPVVITPNGDGLNDVLTFEALDAFPFNSFIVINRWGQQVYFAQPYKNNWEGSNQKGEPLPDGTYFYAMNFDKTVGKVTWGSITIRR